MFVFSMNGFNLYLNILNDMKGLLIVYIYIYLYILYISMYIYIYTAGYYGYTIKKNQGDSLFWTQGTMDDWPVAGADAFGF